MGNVGKEGNEGNVGNVGNVGNKGNIGNKGNNSLGVASLSCWADSLGILAYLTCSCGSEYNYYVTFNWIE